MSFTNFLLPCCLSLFILLIFLTTNTSVCALDLHLCLHGIVSAFQQLREPCSPILCFNSVTHKAIWWLLSWFFFRKLLFVNSHIQFFPCKHSATCCQTYHQRTPIIICKLRSVILKTKEKSQWCYFSVSGVTIFVVTLLTKRVTPLTVTPLTDCRLKK